MDKPGFMTADPPWAYKTYSDKGLGRSAEQHYPCMSIKDIRDLPVASVMAKDSACLLWVTPPFLALGLDVLKAWGFTYKTMGGWVKTKDGRLQIGTGYHMRQAMEPFLIGTRGKGNCPKRGTQKPSIMVTEWPDGSSIIEPEDFFISRERHSQKPEEAYEYAELYAGPYLELFGRTIRPGWTTLGNEVGECLDIRESLAKLAKELSG